MYKNLLAELGRESISKEQIRELLNISFNTLKAKINKEGSDFTVSEMILIKDTYFKDLDLEYLCKSE
jgi:hypothetical protein